MTLQPQRSLGAALAANNDVTMFTGWQKPDLTILDEGRRNPPELPTAMFGKAMPELEKLAADKGAPTDYLALAWLVACASVVGGKRRACPYEGTTWAEPSILWVGLVGDPSHNKSPALDPFAKLLRKIEADRLEDHQEALRDWRTESERAKAEDAKWRKEVESAAKDNMPTPLMPASAAEPAEPHRRRYVVGDATPESIGGILSGNPQGTLMMRDELAGWLSSFDRYNVGGREFWLEAYGGRPYVIDRKGSPEPLMVPYLGVSVVGGIQPAKLADCLLKGSDDGLSARILFAWPKRRPFARPLGVANVAGFEDALRRLEGMEWGYSQDGKRVAISLTLDPAAADVFDNCQQFYIDQGDETTGLLKSFIGKLPGLTLRLAMATELGRWAYGGGDEPRSITAETLEAVADFVSGYVLPMAERVYGDAALPPAERNAATLARYINKAKPRSINARELKRTIRLPGLRDAADIDPALDALVEAHWLRPDPKRHGGTVGRGTSDYLVNPAVIGG